ELEDVVRRMRLLDVSVLFERYPSAIRELARERKKKVRVIVDKGEVAVDKQVLDLIDASVLHLVRNSIDHGIETVAERRAAGKAEQGTVTLAARQHGSRVIIEIRDDGRGMSPDRLRRTAAQRGVMSVEEARALDDDAALALVFRPGFSTRHEVTDVSGRGVGLDVVSDHVRALGGTVGLVTEVGRGTSFTLDLPVSVALLQVLCIRSGAAIFGIPATAVDQVVRVPRAGLERAGHGHAIQVEGRRVPVADLRREQGTGAIEVVVIAHGEARIGLCIDGFLGKRQVVQRSLGAFLSGLSLVSGTALLEEGKVAVLLSAAEIAHRFADGDAKLQLALPELHAATGEWRVLVVDDSELTRDMLVALARRARLIVAEAVNGRDALDKIRAEPPDLILTDLDMPIMNGFQLIAAVRADRTHRDIPIIVLSTRGSDHDKRRALAAGASAYLVKSELKEEALHGAIRRFLAAASDGAVHL
ncbi:MAG TPA: response regulator, partial [Kofleriaceae bacterium]|nr:response regulator [Kofleriaceae bacterium]